MPLRVYWVEEPHIVGCEFSGVVTAEDVDELGRTGAAYAALQPVYVLVDFTSVISMPRNLVNTALRSNTFMAFVEHPHVRWFAFVKPNTAVLFMVETAMRGVSVKVVQSHDEGLVFLQRQIELDRQA